MQRKSYLPVLDVYSYMFILQRALGSCCPIIGLSILKKFLHDFLQSVCGDYLMVSMDLKDVHLQIPVLPELLKYMLFVALGC